MATRSRQLSLAWSNHVDVLTEETQRKSRELLAQLLRAVVEQERDEKGDHDEREDHVATS